MTEQLDGTMRIAGHPVTGTTASIRAVDPASGQPVEPEFPGASIDQVDAAVKAADRAFATFGRTSPSERANLLEAIATEIEHDREQIEARAVLESGLPAGRIHGELDRTTGQLRLFARYLRRGNSLDLRIDPALPDRTPMPRPDLRQMRSPIGPVAVFGASNFPLAFSNAGGDTAAALAAGCPVVVKAHPAHPGTAMLVTRAVDRAVATTGIDPGVYSSILGAGIEVGQALVSHPLIQAVGFTGSRGGGLALVAAANARPQPIPVFAEMSSVNPVVILPGALTPEVANGFVGSLTLGAGQFCTNPGVVFVPAGERGDAFVAEVGRALDVTQGQTMLTAAIASAYSTATASREIDTRQQVVGLGTAGVQANAPASLVTEADAATFIDEPELHEEVFGSAAVIVRYADSAELHTAIDDLGGQLTATIHADDGDADQVAGLLPLFERLAGRIVYNGWPTGVEVSDAIVHGGPFPATSDVRTTSVGTAAIERFQRLIAFQGLPDALLPAALQQGNPWHEQRSVDGNLEAPDKDVTD